MKNENWLLDIDTRLVFKLWAGPGPLHLRICKSPATLAMHLFHDDLFETMIPYLELRVVIELHHAKLIHPNCFSRFMRFRLKGLVEDRIAKRMGLTGDELDRLLKKHKAIIAGSTIMYLAGDLTDEQFKKSDIDIFCHDKLYEKFYKDYKATVEEKWAIRSPLRMDPRDDRLRDSYNIPNEASIGGMYALVYYDQKIQIISKRGHNRPPTWKRYHARVVNSFDLQICASYYDGTNLVLSPEFIQRHERIPLQRVMAQNDFTVDRIKKYLSRGFTFQIVDYFGYNASSASFKKEANLLLKDPKDMKKLESLLD